MAGSVVQLQTSGVLVLVLVEIAINVANVNHIVRFASGLNNNDTLRRFWSKPESVIFYPVQFTMSLSWFFTWGIQAIVRSIIVGFLQIIDAIDAAKDLSLTSEYAILLAANASSAMASMASYITCAGAFPIYQILGTVASTLLASLTQILVHYSPSIGVSALWTCASIVITAGLGWWMSQITKNRTSTTVVRELMPDRSKITPPQTGRPQLIAFLCGFLSILLRIWDELLIVYARHQQGAYLAQVLRNFGGLMVLIGCSFMAIRIVNARIGRNPMDWQWRSIISPSIPSVIGELIILVVKGFLHKGGEGSTPVSAKLILRGIMLYLGRLSMYGIAGFLGSAVYLAVLARAALNALDPGFEGQSELILDDDDSEYELDA